MCGLFSLIVKAFFMSQRDKLLLYQWLSLSMGKIKEGKKGRRKAGQQFIFQKVIVSNPVRQLGEWIVQKLT